MISSEVQRTLVKSPPELWAEISDPDSLAKHLGDFGEIRITRVDPEQKVEWQAGETSGSVIIKASGWGTKVKLTVTRPEPAVEPEPEPEPAAEPEPEAATEPEPEAATEPEPEAATEPEPDPAAEPAKPEAATEPDAELEPQPAGEAEPELIAADEELEALEDHEPFAVPLEGELEHETELIAEFGPSFEHLPAQPLEPRRGFFARLFARFRGEPVAQNDPTELAPVAEAELGRETTDAAGAWASWAEAPEPAQLDSQPASALDAEPEHELLEQPLPDGTGEPLIETDLPASATGDPEDAAAQTPDVEQIENPEQDARDSQPEAPSDGPKDISAEIRAAEEVAAEEVTAVLTGVLDRLGAAHHRPFSRS
jgi:hypothetical protein